MINCFNKSDLTVGLLALVNLTMEGIIKAVVAVGPAASVLFTFTQVLLGFVTILYVLLKAWAIVVTLREKRRKVKQAKARRSRRPRKAQPKKNKKKVGSRPSKRNI